MLRRSVAAVALLVGVSATRLVRAQSVSNGPESLVTVELHAEGGHHVMTLQRRQSRMERLSGPAPRFACPSDCRLRLDPGSYTLGVDVGVAPLSYTRTVALRADSIVLASQPRSHQAADLLFLGSGVAALASIAVLIVYVSGLPIPPPSGYGPGVSPPPAGYDVSVAYVGLGLTAAALALTFGGMGVILANRPRVSVLTPSGGLVRVGAAPLASGGFVASVGLRL